MMKSTKISKKISKNQLIKREYSLDKDPTTSYFIPYT